MATTVTTRRSQQERSETTTSHLVEAARELFAREGYAATSLDDVVAACEVTKGALYHHFAGKAELFEAVFRKEEEALCRELVAAYAKHRDPWKGAYAGARAWLEASLDPGVQRIVLLDAPSVLGWERMREIEADYGLALLKEGIRQAIDAGKVVRRDVDSVSHLLFGALCEGAMFTARADDQRAAKRKFERELKFFFDALAA